MREIVALGLLLAGGLADAQSESQAYLTCGTVACAPNINAVYFVGEVTGIDDLNVGGDYFDVRFNTTPPASPFVLASTTAGPGQPSTGIDAGDAIEKVYGALPPPYGDYGLPGDQGPAFITAFGPAGSLSSQYFGSKELYDIVQTNVGGGNQNFAGVTEAGSTNSGYYYTASGSLINGEGNGVYYTSWTSVAAPLAAPELDPKSTGTALALLLGAILMTGRRATRT